MNPQIIQDEQPRLKNIYLFVGRSGSGKTTITDALWKRFGWKPLWSYTDRPRRTPDKQYHEFLTEIRQKAPAFRHGDEWCHFWSI